MELGVTGAWLLIRDILPRRFSDFCWSTFFTLVHDILTLLCPIIMMEKDDLKRLNASIDAVADMVRTYTGTAAHIVDCTAMDQPCQPYRDLPGYATVVVK